MNFKVYKMNEYDWWATEENMTEAVEEYQKYIGENGICEDARECCLDNEGMWNPCTDQKKLIEFGDYDESISRDPETMKTLFGSMMRRYGDVYEFKPFREVLKVESVKEPCVIATTEW